MNYWVITLLMAIESSFVPFPSEVVVPPAAYLAASGDKGLNVFLVVVCATMGAIVGALVNYMLALYLGRPVVYKFANSRLGHLCLIDEEKVRIAEENFDSHGALGTFVGRLVGASLWNSILAAIGYYLASVVPYDELDTAVAEYSVYLKIAMLVLGAGVVLYLIYKGMKKN